MKSIAALLTVMILFGVSAGCSISDKGDVAQQTKQEYQLQKSEQKIQKTPEQIKEEEIDKLLTSFSLEQKIGQMFMVCYRQDKKGNSILEMNEEIISDLEKYQFGGIILFGENIDTKEQTKALIQEYQSASEIPLFIAVDEEGGRVSRLHTSGKIKAENVPSAMEMAKQGEQAVYNWNKIIAEELLELGFNMDFAPVADIHTNNQNTVIGDRAYGIEPEQTAKMVVEAMKGLQENGIIATVKHFPGHGDTQTDTHKEQTILAYDKQRLETVEWVPFQSAITQGVDCVMAAHIKMPLVTSDNLPASLSKEALSDILRKELGFNGIIVTDALNMGAITNEYNSEQTAVMAVNAGVDILLMPENTQEAFDGIIKAVNEGTISEERIDESVKRILSLKYEKGIL